ncbi:hypothetical protein, partial [Allosphingosinicella sp.]|uniref:hypothetical protein n=1 Tax=Allosphingosinicella sp. TaxID=2823234 RepID=UPI002F08A7E2
GSTLPLAGRVESEGRSHAFNALLDPRGRGLFGLPTVPAPEPESGAPWRSFPSDLSFFSVDADGRIQPAGQLASRLARRDEDGRDELSDGEPDRDDIPGYTCEVSCVDWYGNSRPIFTDGRIFALTATELIEGRLDNGRIVELRRLDFARTVPRAR